MSELATLDDLEQLWRPLTADEERSADTLLRMASAMLRSSVPSVDARVCDGTLDAQTVADVVAMMVVRAMRNPTGVKQETIGPVSYSVDARVAAGYLFIDASELALLAPRARAGAGGVGVGSIRLRAGLA
jgi:N-acyl-L-homoserine lactone synthetase